MKPPVALRFVPVARCAALIALAHLAGCEAQLGDSPGGADGGGSGFDGSGGLPGAPLFECDGDESTAESALERAAAMVATKAEQEDDRACRNHEDCDDGDACTIDDCESGGARCLYDPVHCPIDNDCQTPTCDSAYECPSEHGCSPWEACGLSFVSDGTPCAGGTCLKGACVLGDGPLPCTEQGISNAIEAGGGPYTFACDGPTRVHTRDTLVINSFKDVVLDGGGNLILDGGCSHRVIEVQSRARVELRGLTVIRGVEGGNPGGKIIGGGIYNAGTLTLRDSTVSGNGVAFASGAGIGNEGAMTIINSTVYQNTNGPFTHTGGGLVNQGSMTLINSTVSGNLGGIYNEGGNLTLVSSTIHDQVSSEWPALGNSNGTVTIFQTLIAGSCDWDRSDEAPTLVVSGGYNIESPGNTCGLDQLTDRFSVASEDLRLEELADNGGPTPTHALLPGGVALDVIPSAACEVGADQRGVGRPRGDACDVGAFELEQP